MSIAAKIGEVIQHKGAPWRVIRIITNSSSLFERKGGTPFIITESYIELKSEKGEIDFVVLSRTTQTYTGAPCIIKAPEPLIWNEGLEEANV